MDKINISKSSAKNTLKLLKQLDEGNDKICNVLSHYKVHYLLPAYECVGKIIKQYIIDVEAYLKEK
jgi:hypothetical protein